MTWARAVSIATLAVCVPCLAAQGATNVEVNVHITPQRIGLNEIATLDITARSQGFGSIDLKPSFKLDNLEMVAGPFRSESVRFVNGFTSRSLTLSWQLHPLHPGRARVSGIAVKARGRRIELPDQTLDIENTATLHPGASQNQPPSPFGALTQPFSALSSPFSAPSARPQTIPQVFLQATATPRDPYVGQQVLYTLYLYTQGNVDNIDPEEIPDFHGFWAKEIPQPSHLQPDMVSVHGQRFGRVALLQRALFPLHAGHLDIGKAKARLTLSVPASGAFGGLFERTVEVRRQAPSIPLTVRTLPPAPEGFSGAVGSLSLHASLNPRTIKVGNAATLTVTLSGFGHVQGLSSPSLPPLAGLQVFPPQSESDAKLIGTRVRESATWTYVLVPKKTARWTLPAITVPYFDPATGEYASATTAKLDLTATPAPSPHRTPSTPANPARASHPSEQSKGVVGAFQLHPWQVGGLILALLLAAGTIAALRRRDRPRRAPRTTELEQRYLERLASIVAGGSPRRTASALDEIWREFLDERWAVPMETPSPRWGALLRKEGADLEATDDLVQLADDLHFLRYAPQLSATDELGSELVERSRKLLSRLA